PAYPRHAFTAAENITCDPEGVLARELGVRAVLTRGSMSVGVEEGGLAPQRVVQDPHAILADSRRLVETHHERGAGAMVQIAFAPCSPFSVSRELMAATAELAGEL